MTSVTPICLLCKHYRRALKCAAFPEEIPEDIISGLDDHKSERPGDHGIQFEPLPGSEGRARRFVPAAAAGAT